ncbi:5587_t:CDS:1 [Diversispora eburnea]|uniref:5587_t:CDS:1 n=1 Tax=Diversispora eburnea TaxID=1213867 RepID=A0A9N8V7I0_9GLOM|nr:5587_t:CDS:1 [Diversispora eburnea]
MSRKASKLSEITLSSSTYPSGFSNFSNSQNDKDLISSFRQPQLIKLPFPPKITSSEIINKRKVNEINLRPPNAFLIYRKEYLNYLSSSKHMNLKMTDVSKLVSLHWNNESEMVKDFYKKIAKQVEDELNEKKKHNQKSIRRVIWKNSKRSKKNKLHYLNGAKKSNNVNTKNKSTNITNNVNVVYEFISITPETIINTSLKGNMKTEKNNNKISEQKSDIIPSSFTIPKSEEPPYYTSPTIETNFVTCPTNSEIVSPVLSEDHSWSQRPLFREDQQQNYEYYDFLQNLYFQQDFTNYDSERCDLTHFNL